MRVVSSNSQVVQLVQLVQKFLEVQEDPMLMQTYLMQRKKTE